MLLLPLAGRSAFEVNDEQIAFVQRFKQPLAESSGGHAPVKLSRDPFAGDATGPATIVPASSSRSGIVGMRVVQGAPIGIALPDAIAVRAIVSGDPARALVEESGHVRIVAPGDRLGASSVRRIDESGVLLQNGALLTLKEFKQ